MEFKQWLIINERGDGGDSKHLLGTIAASILGAGVGSLAGPWGGVAGGLLGRDLATRFYPADGTNMKKGMKKNMKK